MPFGSRFRSFSRLMQQQKAAFESNVSRFSDVAASLRRHHHETIQRSFDRYFAGKRSAARSVVDDLFEAGKNEAEQKRILQAFMPEQQVQQKVDEAQEEIRNHIEKEIADFFRSFQQQLQAIAVEAQKAQVGHMAGVDMANADDIGQTADLLRGLGVAGGVLSGLIFTIAATSLLGPIGTVFWIGTANFWNPVGWVLMGVGIVLSIFGWTKAREMQEKLQQAKKEATGKMSRTIDEIEDRIKKDFEKSVEDTITKIQTDHIDVMAQYAQYAEKHLNDVDALTEFLERLNSQMQKAKFQAMIRRVESNDTVIGDDVIEGREGVTVTVSERIKHVENLQKALSRVEERPVAISGGLPCRN